MKFEHILTAGSTAVFECPTGETLARLNQRAKYPNQQYETRICKVLAIKRTSGDNWIAKVDGLPEQKYVGHNPYISVDWCREIYVRGNGVEIEPFQADVCSTAFRSFPFNTRRHKARGVYNMYDSERMVRWLVYRHPLLCDRFPHAYDYNIEAMVKAAISAGVIKLVAPESIYTMTRCTANKKRLVQWLLRNQGRYIYSEREIAAATKQQRIEEQEQYYRDLDNDPFFAD